MRWVFSAVENLKEEEEKEKKTMFTFFFLPWFPLFRPRSFAAIASKDTLVAILSLEHWLFEFFFFLSFFFFFFFLKKILSSELDKVAKEKRTV